MPTSLILVMRGFPETLMTLAVRLPQGLGEDICLLDLPCVRVCVHVGSGQGGCEQLVARQCLALRLAVLGMATFRDLWSHLLGPCGETCSPY